ncbi:MAG: hypothetical protein H6822_02565 [Planctomycetaceae bacterium]|nr:hypothetical protein [Planctomycetales bacterium]MCB9921034.1 hypothetical protein [Planctomycetaceae bacterium]
MKRQSKTQRSAPPKDLVAVALGSFAVSESLESLAAGLVRAAWTSSLRSGISLVAGGSAVVGSSCTHEPAGQWQGFASVSCLSPQQEVVAVSTFEQHEDSFWKQHDIPVSSA